MSCGIDHVNLSASSRDDAVYIAGYVAKIINSWNYYQEVINDTFTMFEQLCV